MASHHDDHLAYGDFHGGDDEGDRGLIGDLGRRFLRRQPQSEAEHHPNPHHTTGMSGFFHKLHDAVEGLVGGGDHHEEESHEQSAQSEQPAPEKEDQPKYADHRFLSFAPPRHDNDIKWFVDACGYMYAVSLALERAKESVWILDWWLSPELYLRRPPARNEQYRLDRMLQAAAERGVKVNIIVYKEVTQALTRKFLNPVVPDYLHSLLPRSTDPITRTLTRLGLDVIFKSLEEVERTDPLIDPPITVSSAHTKHALEALHPNIAVFRHPDHIPDKSNIASDLIQSFKNITLSASSASKLPGDTLKAIYGMDDDTVLYWSHHEKLCLIDGHIAFMGGIDLCYGRWDTNQHSIADAHPGDLDRIIFPGQDYNNARIMDFQDVSNWQNNKLNRTMNSRMGWSDLSMCLSGPVVADLREHFVQRWNYIYNGKYVARDDKRYSALTVGDAAGGAEPGSQHPDSDLAYGDYPPPPPEGYGGEYDGQAENRGMFGWREKVRQVEGQFGYYGIPPHHRPHGNAPVRGSAGIQLTRSCGKWSHGVETEHSIQNAYCQVIRDSKHFIYIENQFFSTASCDDQGPLKNKIGAAIVERIIRAHRNGEHWKMIVVIPAIPAFAGDLRSDESLSTRAIMEFQYKSINRGHGMSIYEQLDKEGINPMDYLRFYNLRNYDRINVSAAMRDVEQRTGVDYEQARKQHDEAFGGEYSEENPPPQDGGAGQAPYEMDGGFDRERYDAYQQGTGQIEEHQGLRGGRWDSVAECYMLDGEDIRNVPWEDGNLNEIDCFVSEELYVHSKILIADDRVVICGSANLNDRSQLGTHDSEIAVVVEDPTAVESYMDGQPYQASKFAASLRRQLFRKHLGLLRPQDPEQPNENYEPIGVSNAYDWGSPEDQTVMDPLSEEFQDLWNARAKTNTEAFAEVFHPVPFDGVRTWEQYDEYYERFFKKSDEEEDKEGKRPSEYKWGHVVAENFNPDPVEGVKEVKEVLSRVKGMLVEMPLLFLKEEDIAKEGLGLNAFTEEVYT
ncbi:phospholipase D/nuclease [Saccharata proteae CBS 121410]|uniref:Phospholipase n=1 Tax=Saccharata proteae CBS 121410 TaxID=1314787 RepID=A0A9P4HVR5_9PEZI|nr:phospholipase D/nuclease [Saccharata proteae CBS 121410]